MLRLSFKKAALNISAFLGVLSSVAIMESSFWGLAGFVALVIGLTTAAVSLYHYYLRKKLPFDIKWVYLTNIGLLLLLAIYHLFTAGFALSLVYLCADAFVFICYFQQNGKFSIFPKS